MGRLYVAILKDDTLDIFFAKDMHDAKCKAILRHGWMLHSVDVWD